MIKNSEEEMAITDDAYSIGEIYTPVILGNGIAAHLYALRLHMEYGVYPVLCGARKGLLDAVNLKCGFLQLSHKVDPRLNVEKLTDLACELDETSLILIPTSKADESFMSENASELSGRYFLISRTPRPRKLLPLDPKFFLSPKECRSNE